MSWLAGLGRDSLDPGYAQQAHRHRHGRTGPAAKWARIGRLVVAMVLAGVVIGAAVRSHQMDAPNAARARAGILADVDRAQQRGAELAETASSLAGRIRARQQSIGAAGGLPSVAGLQAETALTPVHGPGLQVVIDRSGSTTVILDRDVQLLVNGLWASGAEAISVGGIRLRGTSAIRQAGGTILVDNSPTFWPVTIEAIGPAGSMHVAFADTAGYARFAGFAANYGITFTVTDADDLALPAAPAPEWRYARPGTADPAPSSTGTATSSNDTAPSSTAPPT